MNQSNRNPNRTPLILLYTLVFMFALATTPSYAKKINTESLRKMGHNYELGRGVKRNYQKAFSLYCRAVISGNTGANYHLGWLYFNGRGVRRDTGKAAYWFKQGARRGDQVAKNMLRLLRNTKRKKDHTCHNMTSGKDANRTQIELWAHEYAPDYHLEPELVLAVIKEESNFNPKAWSNKDARGLMQLLPATARRFKVKNIWDPVENMRGGMAYLQWLLKRFNGNVRLALAGYNAGENAVARYKGVPPYRETVNYVRRITKKYTKKIHLVSPTR